MRLRHPSLSAPLRRVSLFALRRFTSSSAFGLCLSVCLGLLFARDALACAACRNPTMPITNVGGKPLEQNQGRVGLTVTGTTVRIVHEAGCTDLDNCDEVPVQPLHHHDQRVTPLEMRLQGEYSFNKIWGVDVQLPFKTVFTTVTYVTPDGADYTPLDEGVHHRDEVLYGLGDAWLMGRAQLKLDAWTFVLKAGMTLPFGRTEENPFALGDQGLTHQHIQMGSGTFDPVISAEFERRYKRAFFRGYALALASLYENKKGYRSPLRAQAGMFGGAFLGKSTTADGGLELMHEAPERWDGEIEQDGSLGRTELLFAVNLTQAVGDVQFLFAARFPLVRHIRAGTEEALVYQSPVTLTLGASYTF